MILPISKPPCRRGFTLVELIVAMAIFTVILLLTAQVSNSALTITRSTEARLAAQREASVAAQQLRTDFAQRIQRLDTPVRFEKKAGSDSLVLLTQRLGYSDGFTPDRAVSIMYRLSPTPAMAVFPETLTATNRSRPSPSTQIAPPRSARLRSKRLNCATRLPRPLTRTPAPQPLVAPASRSRLER